MFVSEKETDPFPGEKFCPTKLFSIHHVPSWYHKPYITHGYRSLNHDWNQATWTLFKIHNETGNIWTHLSSAVFFLSLTPYIIGYQLHDADLTSRLLVLLYMFACITCFLASTSYHMYDCTNYELSSCFLRIDIKCILFLITSSCVPPLHYFFYYHSILRAFYLGLALTIGLCTWRLLTYFDTHPHLEMQKNMVLIINALWGVIPILHRFILCIYNSSDGDHMPCSTLHFFLRRLGLVYLLYVTGGVFYFSKWPECLWGKNYQKIDDEKEWKRRWVNYIGMSHQWWHLFITIASLSWLITIVQLFKIDC